MLVMQQQRGRSVPWALVALASLLGVASWRLGLSGVSWVSSGLSGMSVG